MQGKTSWLNPTEAYGLTEELPLKQSQVDAWRETGCVLVDGLFPLDLVRQVEDETKIFFKDHINSIDDFGSNGLMEFPYESVAMNDLSLHHRILRAVKQLLGQDDIRLTQADIWAKKSNQVGKDAFNNCDQRMHIDYPNHTLVHPPSWDTPEAIACIIYAV